MPAIAAELKPLRLDKARFRTVLTPLAETDWGEHGCERVHFEVATNPGAPFGPLARIASGGELSRFMLALEAGPRRHLLGADPDLRRGRQRHRRRRRGRGRRALAAPRHAICRCSS